MSATDWFQAARFGLFVHWDHASQQGYEASWPLHGRSGAMRSAPSAAAYHASVETFDPKSWNPTDDGDDFEADLAELANDPATQDWWSLTDPGRFRLPNGGPDQQWTTMKSVFFMS